VTEPTVTTAPKSPASTANTDTPHLIPARRGKIGRPSKYNPPTVRKICRGIAEGLPNKLAAASAGISYETFCVWRRSFPEFDQAVEKALGDGIKKRLAIIKAAGEQGDWKAAAWHLEHVFPELFARNRIELEAVGELEHRFVIPVKVLDEIAARRRELGK
jgi:hypothetical protein